MENQRFPFPKNIFCIVFFSASLLLLNEYSHLKRDTMLLAGLNDLDQDKDIHSSFDQSNDSYFPTNPFELMNVLKQIEARNEGKSPSDAIDDALKAFESEEQEDSSFDTDI